MMLHKWKIWWKYHFTTEKGRHDTKEYILLMVFLVLLIVILGIGR